MQLVKAVKGVAHFATGRLQNRPVHLNLEVTKFCNATCDFCDYWKTEEELRLDDYAEIVRKFKPMVVTLTGGEPMLRKDLPDIVRSIKQAAFFVHLSMVTNGSLLTLDKARALREAGLDQLCISLDYMGERHTKSRGCENLFEHIAEITQALPPMGYERVAFNTIIMEDNLDDLLPIVRFAKEREMYVNFSTYSSAKNGQTRHFISEASREKLLGTIRQLLLAKREMRNILSSDYYLSRIPDFFFGGGIDGCKAGIRWFQITPAGMVKPCAELPLLTHYKDFEPGADVINGCKACWYSCRGEEEAPLSFSRVTELAGFPVYSDPPSPRIAALLPAK
ncbi:MAG: radical SAM protein [Nitrospirae bacterium]|nr:radical SAM protein [Nitrospirota bacterium]